MGLRYGVIDASLPRRGGKPPAFGEPPFDDVDPNSSLFGMPVMRAPEHELFHAAALALLPAWDRYWLHLMTQGIAPGGAASQASSSLRRLTRVILQWERVRVITGEPPTYSRADELLDVLTLAFVHLMGLFDALAVVAAKVTGPMVKGKLIKEERIAWQNEDFLTALAAVAPSIAAIMARGSTQELSLSAIRTIRNTIHKQMPDPTLSQSGPDPLLTEHMIMFECGAHDEVVDALQRAGWTKYVGATVTADMSLIQPDLAKGMLFIRPRLLLGCALSDAVPIINALMAATPVESLGPPIEALDPGRSLYPLSLQRYAADKFGLTHLAKSLGTLPGFTDDEHAQHRRPS